MAGGFGDCDFGTGTFGDPCPPVPPVVGNDHIVGVNTSSLRTFMFAGQTVELDESDPGWALSLSQQWIVAATDNGLPDPVVVPSPDWPT